MNVLNALQRCGYASAKGEKKSFSFKLVRIKTEIWFDKLAAHAISRMGRRTSRHQGSRLIIYEHRCISYIKKTNFEEGCRLIAARIALIYRWLFFTIKDFFDTHQRLISGRYTQALYFRSQTACILRHFNIFSPSKELETSMSLAPSLVRRLQLGGTIRVLIGDTNIRYLAEFNGSRV